MENTVVKVEEKDQVSQIIDRLYYHEFMMDELNASIAEYSKEFTDYNREFEEFKGRYVEGLKIVLDRRLMKDLKNILHMA